MKKHVDLKQALFGIVVLAILSGCSNRDPHFDIMGKSQGFLSAPANNKVDILWVIDNSGTMGPKQTNLANSINSFMSQFVTKDFDYQISVVTTDVRAPALGQGACIVGNPVLITPSTPDPVTALAANANVGFFGDAAAKGLDAVKTALEAPNVTGCNSGFLRAGAHLAVIFFSDADDNDSATTVDALIAFLDSVKPPVTSSTGVAVRPYSLSAMVARDATTPLCQALGPFTETGAKFIDAANKTDGVIADICEPDFSDGLLAVSTRILEATTAVRLVSAPNVSTIEVYVNGNSIANDSANGWTFDGVKGLIVFHGAAIPRGSSASITVNYVPIDIVR